MWICCITLFFITRRCGVRLWWYVEESVRNGCERLIERVSLTLVTILKEARISN